MELFFVLQTSFHSEGDDYDLQTIQQKGLDKNIWQFSRSRKHYSGLEKTQIDPTN